MRLADERARPVKTQFGGLYGHSWIKARPGTSIAQAIQIWHTYHADEERHWRAREMTQEGIKRQVKDIERKVAIVRDYENPLTPPTLKDPDRWEMAVTSFSNDVSREGYVRVASRWARAIEEELQAGRTLEEVALSTFENANLEQRDMDTVVGILSQTWVHGDTLKKWFRGSKEENARRWKS
ncbi:hypothetical protein HY622_02960 [Candidatus Uhrbacteria bacterium]|nr:hypothetical protein [Candidatus Uhrbacteria bacterium]